MLYTLQLSTQQTRRSAIITFSNITPEEFIRLNENIIHSEVLKYFDMFSEQIKELQKEVEQLNRSEELAWEQVEFARELIQQIDNFVENTLTKNKLIEYNSLRENSYFEV